MWVQFTIAAVVMGGGPEKGYKSSAKWTFKDCIFRKKLWLFYWLSGRRYLFFHQFFSYSGVQSHAKYFFLRDMYVLFSYCTISSTRSTS